MYTSFLDVIEDMLTRAPDLSAMQWTYNFTSVYSHPTTTLRCKEMYW